MLSAVFLRELRRQLRRPLVLGGAAVLAAVAFNDITITSPTASGLIRIGRLPHDAPLVLLRLLTAVTAVGSLAVALIVAPSVRRDFDYGYFPFLFTTPLRKGDYLGGRFLGSLAASCLLAGGAVLGMSVGLLTLDPTFRVGTGPAAYGVALAWVAPTVVLVGSLFFMVGTFTRRPATTYVAAVVATVLFFVVQGMASELVLGGAGSGLTARLVALADPSGMAALQLATRDWTVAEQSTRGLPPDAFLIGHRLLWLTVAGALFVVTAARFRMLQPLEGPPRKRARRGTTDAPPAPRALRSLRTSPTWGARTSLRQLGRLVGTEVVRTFRHVAFLVLAGVMLVQFHSNFVENVRGAGVRPRTGFLLNHGLVGIDVPVVLLTLFFAGVLVWRERGTGEQGIFDALPVPDGVRVTAKLGALFAVQAAYAGLVVVSGIFVQVVVFGYGRVEPTLYLAAVGGVHLLGWMQIAVGTVLLHALSPRREVGYALSVVFTLAFLSMPALGLEEPIFRYAAVPGYTYSEMNGFGPFGLPLALHRLLWTGVALLLGLGAVLYWPRGLRTGWRPVRGRTFGRARLTAWGMVGLGLLLAGGAGIAMVSGPPSRPDPGAVFAAYELRHGSRAGAPQPIATALDLHADLLPSERSARLRGRYRLENRTGEALRSVHVTLVPTHGATRMELRLDRSSGMEVDPVTGFTTFTLDRPLQPGDSASLVFALSFEAPGPGRRPDPALVRNGMIVHGFFGEAGFFPLVGYRPELELQDPAMREHHGLAGPATTRRLREDPATRATPSRSWIRFQAVVSTDPGQTPAAPGRIVERWVEGGRPHVRVTADTVMAHEIAVVSGRWDLAVDSIRGTRVEVLYHPAHADNVPRMIGGLLRGVDLGVRDLGPYPYGELRVVEVPGYAVVQGTAVSKPGLIVWNETGGFVTVPPVEGEVDPVFSTAAHETAHQWWGHQVRPAAFTDGVLALVETTAQHHRLRALRSEYPAGAVDRFLERSRRDYFVLRNRATADERPVVTARSGYVAYEKGTLAMNALARWDGGETLDGALRRLVARYALAPAPYPTSAEWLDAVRGALPDSLAFLAEDWLETLTLHEASVDEAVARRAPDGSWDARARVRFRRLRSDGRGDETAMAPLGLVEVAFLDEDGELLGTARRLGRDSVVDLSATLAAPPARVLVDPARLLLERDREDNVAPVDTGPAG